MCDHRQAIAIAANNLGQFPKFEELGVDAESIRIQRVCYQNPMKIKRFPIRMQRVWYHNPMKLQRLKVSYQNNYQGFAEN